MAFACQRVYWLKVEWLTPDPTGGPSATFERDEALVRSADLVLAYFASDRPTGGTARVVERAQDVGTPVYAYGLRDGRWARIGEHDPENAWWNAVPGP
jgi:hypothetical protein